MTDTLRVALVSPLWNEERTLRSLAATVEVQTQLPEAWILVDDGSTDATLEIAEDIAERNSFVSVVRHRRESQYGADVGAPAAAFRCGIDTLREEGVEFDVVMKVDGDLCLDRRLVQAVAQAFAAEPQLGVASSTMFVADRHGVRLDKPGGRHTRGATKAYRRECLAAIGGVQVCLGWDTIDELTAELRGFSVATIADAHAVQVRPMGATTGIYRGRVRAGRAAYLLGYPAWAIVARALRRSLERPVVVGSVCLLYGYIRACWRQEPYVAAPEVIRHLRKTQRQRLRRFGRVSGPT